MINKEQNKEETYPSKKSNSTFIVKGTDARAYLIITGEAATIPKVVKEAARIRKSGADFNTVSWVARQFSNTY